MSLETRPGNPCERASHGFQGEDCVKGLGLLQPYSEIAKLGFGHASRSEIVPEFLQHDFTGNRGWFGRTLDANQCGILNRARRDKGCQVAEPSGGENGDMMVDAKMHGLDRKQATPAGKYDRLGLR
jgi:hypothetical protein